jgi:hypothetical protein
MINFRYTKLGAKLNGRKDGKLGIPVNGKTPSYIKELLNIGKACIHNLIKKWAKKDEPLKSYWRELTSMKNAINAKITDYNNDIKVFLASSGDTDRLGKISSPKRFWILIFLIFCFEIPLNAVAFRFFKESEIFCYALSSGIAIALLVMTHFLGILMHDSATIVKRIVLSILICFILTICFALGYLRELYLMKIGQAEINVLMVLIFAAINMLLLTSAVFISYYTTDPEKKTLNYIKLKLGRFEKDADRIERAIENVRTKREKRFEQCWNNAGEIKNAIEQRSHIYWVSNIRARKDKDLNFADVTLELPEELNKLDWEIIDNGGNNHDKTFKYNIAGYNN